jgi:hypothetical protein
VGGGGGGWHGGGGGGWHGGGGGWHGGGGGWHGGGSGWHGGSWGSSGWRGGYWRGSGWGWRGGWGPYWRSGWWGGYWGPNVGIYVGAPFWGWGMPFYSAAWAPFYAASWAPLDTGTVIDDNTGFDAPLAQAPALAQTTYWYYCKNPAGYYPYVQNCNQAWVPVVPQAVPPPPAN